MNLKSIFALLGGCLMGLAALWSFVAVRLSANLVISVLAEFASYWLALFAVSFGAYLVLRNQERPIALVRLLCRCSCVGLALVVVVVSWQRSDDQFAFWKMRAIPSSAWPRMASDLEAFGRQVAQGGNTALPATKPPPKSLQQLGLGADYSGGVANVWDSPQYTGVFAVITFGYKARSWGLLVGPEERAKSYCPGGAYFRVSTNAFFFVGPRG
jgi:hypothetical protein